MPQEERIEVGILIETINTLKPYLNEEGIKRLEERQGIDFEGFISTAREELGMKRVRIELNLPRKVERKDR